MQAQYICPIVTVFDDNNQIDMQMMKKLFDHILGGGIDGIAIMGSAGEFYSMTMEEAKKFTKESLSYLKGKTKVYVGTGRLISEETVGLSNYALEMGADAAMVVAPYYIGTWEVGVEAYYDKILSEIKGNVILYNYPDRTGFDMTAELILRLKDKHDNVVGVKDTMSDASHTRRLINKIKPLYPELAIYSGYDENFAHVVSCGGDGCIAGLSNLIPDVCSEWVKAFKEENLLKICCIQKMIDSVMEMYTISTPFMPAMKYALNEIGLNVRTKCRMPIADLTEEEKKAVERLVKNIYK